MDCHFDAPGSDAIEAAFRQAADGRPDAVVIFGGPVFILRRAQVAELVAQYRLPATYGTREQVVAGGLIGYSANIADLYRRAATYVDKILRGANPAELPVEQPTNFDLVINLRTAQALNLSIPPSVLAQVSEIIQ